MIRLVQNKLIIPQGDTGTFSVPILPSFVQGDTAIFFIIDNTTQSIIFSKQCQYENNLLIVKFSHQDTITLPAGNYVWDIKTYKNPEIDEGKVISADEVNSYYAVFRMPRCEIKKTGDSMVQTSSSAINQSYLLQQRLIRLENKINILENKFNELISEDNAL